MINKFIRIVVHNEMSTDEHALARTRANYGPGTTCGPLSFLIRAAELEEVILIAGKSLNS